VPVCCCLVVACFAVVRAWCAAGLAAELALAEAAVRGLQLLSTSAAPAIAARPAVNPGAFVMSMRLLCPDLPPFNAMRRVSQ
jgi:hypothetical protein